MGTTLPPTPPHARSGRLARRDPQGRYPGRRLGAAPGGRSPPAPVRVVEGGMTPALPRTASTPRNPLHGRRRAFVRPGVAHASPAEQAPHWCRHTDGRGPAFSVGLVDDGCRAIGTTAEQEPADVRAEDPQAGQGRAHDYADRRQGTRPGQGYQPPGAAEGAAGGAARARRSRRRGRSTGPTRPASGCG